MSKQVELQPCPLCGQPFQGFFGSKNRHVCRECAAQIRDERGRRVVFRDTRTSMFGAEYRAYDAETGQARADNSCYVRGVRCVGVAGRWDDLQIDVAEALAPPPQPSRMRVLGCLLGGALGDALGYPIEFLQLAEIHAEHGARTPRRLNLGEGPLALISDDTQMTLFTAEGITLARRKGHPVEGWVGHVRDAYLRWYATQQTLTEAERAPFGAALTAGSLREEPRLQSARAPGTTCMATLQRTLDTNVRYDLSRPPNHSKGCGAVMRMAPVGLAAYTEEQAFEVGRDAGLLTHGHPSGYLAAAYFAAVIHLLVREVPLPAALERADRLLAREPGREELEAIVARARALAQAGRPTPAAVESLGRGWVGDEALAIGLLCALTADMDAPDGVADALWRAACHSGDSDSTASLTGNLLGAAHGLGRLPAGWLAQLELADVIERTALELHDAAYGLHREEAPAAATRQPVVAEGAPRRPLRLLEARQVAQIEALLGRPLDASDLCLVPGLQRLSSQQIEIARRLAVARQLGLGALYVREVIPPGTRMNEIGRFFVDVVEGGSDPLTWRAR